MLLSYYYPEIRSNVRIRSEKLCIDQSFTPSASQTPISIQELCELSHNESIDMVRAYIPEDAEAFYVDYNTQEKVKVVGWVDMSVFDKAEPYH